MQQQEIIDAVMQDRKDVAMDNGIIVKKTNFIDIPYASWKMEQTITVRIFRDAHVWVYVHDGEGRKPSSPNQMINGSKVYKSNTMMDLLYLYIK